MNIFIIGLSHHQAPVAVREKFSGREGLERHLYDHQAESGALTESLVLSTCNRLEILAVANRFEEGRRAVLASLAEVSGLPVEEFRPYLHEYVGLEAARHLFRVAGSLDSLVLGEPQILGQVKEAFRQALDRRQAGTLINKLMHKTFRAAKRVRSETTLAGGAVSVAGAAVALARSLKGGQLYDQSVLLLGAGPMAALAAAHLKKRSPADLVIMNRSRAKAEILACKHEARCRPWEELAPAILEADLIIAATGAQSPILTLENMEKIMALRSRPLTVIDIGVPRNASHDLKHLDRVILRNIDDLNEVVWESRAARLEAAKQAEAIIEEEVAKFGRWLNSLASRPTVAALTRKAERIRRLELTRTMSQHDFSPEQAASLEAMTSALVRRLLHDPLAFIKNTKPARGRCSGSAGGCSGPADGCAPPERCLDSIRQAFNLEADS